MKLNAKQKASRNKRGSAMVMVTLVLVAMAGLSLSVLAVTNSSNDSLREARERTSAMYVAEAGIAQALFDLQNGGTGVVGSEGAPAAYEQSDFWVSVTDMGGGSKSLVATGFDKGAGYRIEVLVDKETTTNFIWAAFGDVNMSMESNARVDSYDSSLGLYEAQNVNGSGSNMYALDGGNVGSNQNVTTTSNTKVWGDATPGPGGTASISGLVTGSTTPAAEAIPLEPLDIPVIASSGNMIVAGGTTSTLPAGSYNYGDFNLGTGSTLIITGPATIVVTDMALASNSELIVDASAGGVEFFVLDDFTMNSNTLIASTTFTPSDVTINLESDNVIDPDTSVDLDEIDFDSNAKLYGTIYAPNASVEINSNFELFGALIAYEVHLDSNSRIHYDEALANANANATDLYTMSLWRGAPYQSGASTPWVTSSAPKAGGGNDY